MKELKLRLDSSNRLTGLRSMKTLFISLEALFLFVSTSFSQSTSVFAANYFNKDNAQPPLKVGKGFHINDVYKQTRFCFTPESSSKEKLSQQESATTTNINLYYTEDDEQFHELQNQGGSGKISFLIINYNYLYGTYP